VRFLAGALVALACGAAGAAIVTTPAGVVTGTPTPGYSDPFTLDVWQRVNVRTGSTIGITDDYPNLTQASGLLTSSDGGGKADWQYIRSTPLGRLGDFTSATYQWYRDGDSSSVAGHLHPVLRLILDIDGDLQTPNDIAYLVFERAYQGGGTVDVPTDAWVTENISSGTIMWVSQPGVAPSSIEEVYNRPLSAYMDGSYTPTGNFSQITGNSLVLGVQSGIGSGWNGTFSGAVDNIGVRVGETALGPDNFELTVPQPPATPTAVPTLEIWGLLGLAGLMAGFGAWRQRRRG